VVSAVNDAILPMIRSGQGVGIVVGLIDNGQRYELGYGSTSRLLGECPTGKTVFEIGSITKVFTSVLLAQTVNQGGLALAEPVQPHLSEGVTLPSFEGREITFLDLATHTSGLPGIPDDLASAPGYCVLNPYAHYTVESLYAFLSRYELARAPGVQYEYSNLGFGLLGNVLASKAGTSYEELVRSRICEPLSLGDTSISLSDDQRRRLAKGYSTFLSLGGRSLVMGTPTWDLPAFEGAGALRSTLDDMCSFAEACMALVDTPLEDAIALSVEPRFTVNEFLSVGLGWHLLDPGDGGEPVVWHNGGTGGYTSFMGLLPARKTAVIVLNNTDAGPDLAALRILGQLAGRDFVGPSPA